jgi:hypothetical protein
MCSYLLVDECSHVKHRSIPAVRNMTPSFEQIRATKMVIWRLVLHSFSVLAMRWFGKTVSATFRKEKSTYR